MKRRLITITVATGAAVAVAFAQTTTAPHGCLHDDGETELQAALKNSALKLVRHINALEFAEFMHSRPFLPLERLSITQGIPQGFEVHLLTDGKEYAFSVKDRTDPCGFALFSDSYQGGRIYVGQGLR